MLKNSAGTTLCATYNYGHLCGTSTFSPDDAMLFEI